MWCGKFHGYVNDFFNETTYQHKPWLVGFHECFQEYTGGTMLGSCISLSMQAAKPFLEGFAHFLQAMVIAMAEAQSSMLESALEGKLSCCPSSVPTSNTWLSFDVRHLIQAMTLVQDITITEKPSDVSSCLLLLACCFLMLTHERCR